MFSPSDRRTAATMFLTAVTLTSVVWAQQSSRIKIDGKVVPGQSISVKGKTYIPLDALRAGGLGVRLSGGVVELSTAGGAATATGGANQQEGVEGKIGEWLFNGVWRFRVLSVEKASADVGEGWVAKVEIRNGSKFNGYSPAGTGGEGISLVTEDGASFAAASNAVDLMDKGLAQGASNIQSVYFATGSASLPTRLILRFNTQGVANTPLRFTVPNPTFRIDVKSR